MKNETESTTEKKDVNAEEDTSKSTSEKLKFKWSQEVPQYGDKLLKRLDEFRKKNMLYDVTLKATDDDLPAHKVVLAVCGGMFRSYFIDAKTKRISSDVTEVSFSCPASGLRPILKFAYSGVLEINQNNLLPTLLAATITEMREVQEICTDIVMSRLGWMLTFDGSSDTISCMNTEGTTNKNHETSPTLEQAFSFLHKYLEVNSDHFTSLPKPAPAPAEKSSDAVETVAYPCLKEVETKWPELKHVYMSIIECLHKAEPKAKPKNIKPITKESNTKDDVEEKPKLNDAKEKKKYSGHKATNGDSAKYSEVPADVKPKENDQTAPVPDSEAAQSTIKEKPIPLARKPSTNDPVKPPVCKPRTITSQTHTRSLSNGRNEMKKQSPPPFREHSKTMFSASGSSKTPQKLTAPPPPNPTPSPTPPRRKHAAPKPPGPPPSVVASSTKSASATETPIKNNAQPQSGRSTPTSAHKVPPPRPKPPSIRKKLVEVKPEGNSTDGGEVYDDALNPFADDDEPSEESPPAAEPTPDVSSKSEENDYDESLNPFG